MLIIKGDRSFDSTAFLAPIVMVSCTIFDGYNFILLEGVGFFDSEVYIVLVLVVLNGDVNIKEDSSSLPSASASASLSVALIRLGLLLRLSQFSCLYFLNKCIM